MKHYLFLIWLRGQTRPNSFTAAGESIPSALAMLLLSAGIKINEIDRIEIYP